MDKDDSIIYYIISIIAILGVVGAMTLFTLHQSVSEGAAFKSLQTIDEPVRQVTEPVETELSQYQLSDSQLADIFPELDPITAQARIHNFVSEDEPPKVMDFYGTVMIDNQELRPGRIVEAVAPGVDAQGQDYVCGRYTIGEQPGLIGEGGYLHCQCGGGLFPDCDNAEIQFRTECRGQEKYFYIEGDEIYVGDKISDISLTGYTPYDYTDTEYMGEVLLNGEPVVGSYLIQARVENSYFFKSFYGSSTFEGFLLEPENVDQCDIIEPEFTLYDLLGNKVSTEVIGSTILDGNLKDIVFNIVDQEMQVTGTLYMDGIPAGDGQLIRFYRYVNNKRYEQGNVITGEDGNFVATVKCNKPACEENDEIFAEVFNDYLDDWTEVNEPPLLFSENTELTQDFSVNISYRNYEGRIYLGEKPALAGTQVRVTYIGGSDTIPGRRTICGSAETVQDGYYSVQCHCPYGNQCDEPDMDVEFKISPYTSTTYYLAQETGDDSWSSPTVDVEVNISLTGFDYTKVTGSLTVDGWPAPPDMSIMLFNDSRQLWSSYCGGTRSKTQEDGSFEAYCYCGHHQVPDCGDDRELLLIATPPGPSYRDAIFNVSINQTIFSDEQSYDLEGTLTNKLAYYQGYARANAMQAPEGTSISAGPEGWTYNNCGSVRENYGNAVDENGSFLLECWCNQDFVPDTIYLPGCSVGGNMSFSMGAPGYFFRDTVSSGQNTFQPGQINEVIVSGYESSTVCDDGTHSYECGPNKPQRCMEQTWNTAGWVNDCSFCGCPTTDASGDKTTEYSCCPDGSCSQHAELIDGEIVCSVGIQGTDPDGVGQ